MECSVHVFILLLLSCIFFYFFDSVATDAYDICLNTTLNAYHYSEFCVCAYVCACVFVHACHAHVLVQIASLLLLSLPCASDAKRSHVPLLPTLGLGMVVADTDFQVLHVAWDAMSVLMFTHQYSDLTVQCDVYACDRKWSTHLQ